MAKKVATIIGAGPAGLTAAYELLLRTDIKPIVLEKTRHIGGISTTINYKGNRMDIGGHRFFSKSDRVMEWWLNILPLQRVNAPDQVIAYQQKFRVVNAYHDGPDPDIDDRVMQRRRASASQWYRRPKEGIEIAAIRQSGSGMAGGGEPSLQSRDNTDGFVPSRRSGPLLTVGLTGVRP
jgi:phytoene dehydrogenase-like protein